MSRKRINQAWALQSKLEDKMHGFFTRFRIIVLVSFFVSSFFLFSNMNLCRYTIDIVILLSGYVMLLSLPIYFCWLYERYEKVKVAQ